MLLAGVRVHDPSKSHYGGSGALKKEAQSGIGDGREYLPGKAATRRG